MACIVMYNTLTVNVIVKKKHVVDSMYRHLLLLFLDKFFHVMLEDGNNRTSNLITLTTHLISHKNISEISS